MTSSASAAVPVALGTFTGIAARCHGAATVGAGGAAGGDDDEEDQRAQTPGATALDARNGSRRSAVRETGPRRCIVRRSEATPTVQSVQEVSDGQLDCQPDDETPPPPSSAPLKPFPYPSSPSPPNIPFLWISRLQAKRSMA